MKLKTTLALVDDHCLFRKSLMSLIGEFHELEVVIEAEHGLDVLKKLEVQQPDVILLDLEMPVMDGFKALGFIRKNHPGIKIIILTMFQTEELIYKLVEMGAHGFLTKNMEIEEVVRAIKKVKDCGYYFNESISKAMLNGIVNGKQTGSNILPLSHREVEVVKLICQQYTNKEIADKLCLSPRTIDTYRENIFVKTGAKNIVGVALYAYRNNMVE
jgi:two-component system, NarL family, response regulator DegU